MDVDDVSSSESAVGDGMSILAEEEVVDTKELGDASKEAGASATAAVQATLVPHRGVVDISYDGFEGLYYLSHAVTGESQPLLAGGSWELAYDDDGFAIAQACRSSSTTT